MAKIQSIAVEHLKKDRVLAKIIQTTDLSIKMGKGPVYDQLIRALVSQQLSTKAADTIYGRFITLLGGTAIPEHLINMDLSTLRSVGLSMQKAQYVKNVSQFFLDKGLDNNVWKKMSDEEILETLTTIKGVGKWTAQMVLIFDLNRHDVFPVDDLIIRNSIIKHYNVLETGKAQLERLHRISAKWSPYRSIACRYLWASKDQLK